MKDTRRDLIQYQPNTKGYCVYVKGIPTAGCLTAFKTLKILHI